MKSSPNERIEMKRYTRYKAPSMQRYVSGKDVSLLDLADQHASEHDSGGSYGMVALLAKSKPFEFGYNSLSSPAILKSPIYPDMCGMHAELDLWRKCRDDMRGGSVYIAGRATKSSNRMANTSPCVYCAAILTLVKVRHVIFFLDSTIVKTSPELLTDAKTMESL